MSRKHIQQQQNQVHAMAIYLFILIYFHTSHLGTYHGNGKGHVHYASSGNLQIGITNIKLKGILVNYLNNLHKYIIHYKTICDRVSLGASLK
jgi:hypothetical protein